MGTGCARTRLSYLAIAKNILVNLADQLVEAGNPIKLNDRGTVIDALRITRAGLVRALKTEKILRENL